MKIIISKNPQNRLYHIPEEVAVIDITHCMLAIQSLAAMAHEVSRSPQDYGEAAQFMAYKIQMIEKSLGPQLNEFRKLGT